MVCHYALLVRSLSRGPASKQHLHIWPQAKELKKWDKSTRIESRTFKHGEWKMASIYSAPSACGVSFQKEENDTLWHTSNNNNNESDLMWFNVI